MKDFTLAISVVVIMNVVMFTANKLQERRQAKKAEIQLNINQNK